MDSNYRSLSEFAVHRMANICRRSGLDPVQDARTGSAGAREDRVLDRIDPARPTRRPEMIDALCLLVTVAESSHREFYSAAHGGRNHLILVGDIDQNQRHT